MPLLEDEFGKDKRSLQALYLGNWLTDVSQSVDPVAYSAGASDVKKAIDGVMSEILSTIFGSEESLRGRVFRPLKDLLTDYADKARKELHGLIDSLLEAQTNERDSRAAVFLRSATLVKGYYKFVHPNRMNFDCFMRVFGRPNDTRGATERSPADDRPGAYTQYYPHEHLDRPECLPPKDPRIFSPGLQTPHRPFYITPGKRGPGPRSPRSPKGLDPRPDLYSYLRDDIEMTAGLLAEVDLAFERVFAEGIRDDDCEWYVTLAKLGHALHQVEDFFAHSNWIELASQRGDLGPKLLSKMIPPGSDAKFRDRAYTTYRKRLKRHLTEPLEKWENHPEEHWVVTGAFDILDTLYSLSHIADELFGEDVSEPKTPHEQAQKAMRDALEFLTDPDNASKDPNNDIARNVRKLQGPRGSREVAEQVAREVPLLQGAPQEVQEAFVNVLVWGSQVRAGFTIYQAIKQIAAFMTDPLGWLTNWLPEELKKRVKDAVKAYGRERVYEWLGAVRIGYHSLLAKDYAIDPFYKQPLPFYEQQKQCATAIHWYIVNTLLRRPAEKSGYYVDWLELLEHFLRNPLPPKGGSYIVKRGYIPVTVIHTVAYKEQLQARNPLYSLVDKYKGTAVNPSKFTWRTIADANFNTANLSDKDAQVVINKILRDRAWGIPVTPPNYAFKPGLRILIPQQKYPAIFLVPARDDPAWFKDVLEKDWTVFKGYEDPDSQTSEPPRQYHTPVTISSTELNVLILRGQKLRREARQFYRPTPKSDESKQAVCF